MIYDVAQLNIPSSLVAVRERAKIGLNNGKQKVLLEFSTKIPASFRQPGYVATKI